MEELSIEEKAKCYDKALERARKEYKNHEAFKGFCEMLSHVFPELRESDKENKDEKIIKVLTQLVNDYPSMDLFIKYDIHSYEVIAWLEKQGEKKRWSEEDENINHSIIDILTKQGFQTQVNWLKSLKERI